MISGLLVIDKDPGPTSHDVVDVVRRILGQRKVGHSGTLDPPASGILLAGVGRATRLMQFLTHLPKSYRAAVRFGVTTTTLDAEGEVVSESPCTFSEEQLRTAMLRFVGEIQQTPPMFSAVKVRGERLHRAARRGEEVNRTPRTVRVHSLELLGFDPTKFTCSFDITCSAGTYVRTVAADIGEELGCGAHLTALRRTAIGSFGEKESVTLSELEAMDDPADAVLGLAEAMRDFPRVVASDEEVDDLRHGRSVKVTASPTRPRELSVIAKPRSGDLPAHQAGMTAGIPVAVVDGSGHLIAVCRRRADVLKPEVVVS